MQTKKNQYWGLSLQEFLLEIGTDTNAGLSEKERSKRLKKYGLNLCEKKKKHNWLSRLFERIKSPLVVMLILIGAVSLLIDDIISFFVIIIILTISVGLDIYQELKALKEIKAVKDFVTLKTTVLINSNENELLNSKIVPGDVIILSAGDLVPADAVIISSKEFIVDQSTFSGEADPIEKFPLLGTIPQKTEQPLYKYPHVALAGSIVLCGTAKLVIFNTGLDTLLGKVTAVSEKKVFVNYFQEKIKKLGFLIMGVTAISSLTILITNIYFNKASFELFFFILALAIGFTPELLPMIVTVTLSKGIQEIAKKNMIIKNFLALQNLGRINLLCTDKTGTLTEGNIRLERCLDLHGRPDAEILKLAYLNSYFQRGLKSFIDQSIILAPVLVNPGYKKLDEIPFDFKRRMLSVLLQDEKYNLLITKGSPEKVLACCKYYQDVEEIKPLSLDKLKETTAQVNNFYKRGYRVIGVAYQKLESRVQTVDIAAENNLILMGYLLFIDPPKESAKETVKKLNDAEVKIKVITGDCYPVAINVCSMIGINVSQSLCGDDIEFTDNQNLVKMACNTTLFYSVSPLQKARIIKVLRINGDVVGYLGDGVNDVPALQEADVGISVDKAAAAAKEASDAIMLAPELDILLNAILLGRKSLVNIMKYLIIVFSANFGNMISMVVASFTLTILPMLPLQILINNLLSDFAELVIPLDKVNITSLKNPQEISIKTIYQSMLIFGGLSSIFDLFFFYLLYGLLQVDEKIFHTAWFLQSISSQILIFFVLRGQVLTIKTLPSWPILVYLLILLLIIFIMPFFKFADYIGFAPINGLLLMLILLLVLAYLISAALIKRAVFNYNNDVHLP